MMASSDIISLHARLNVHVFVYYVNSKRVRVFPVPGVRSALKLEICDSSVCCKSVNGLFSETTKCFLLSEESELFELEDDALPSDELLSVMT